MSESRTTGSRFLGLSLVFSLLVIAAIGQANIQTAQAQSVGAFKGAKLELAPPRNSDGSFKSIKAIIDAASASGSFYIEGNVFVTGTISNCTLPDGAEGLVDASFDPVARRLIYNGAGRRVGIYRMWGVVRNGANAGTTSGSGQEGNNLTGGTVAVVNLSLDLESYNGTIQLQGTIGRVFGAIESAALPAPTPGLSPIGHPLTDIFTITGGTETFRGASGDADLTPLTPEPKNTTGQVSCPTGFFQIVLQEAPKLPTRFTNLIP